jgi:hypothetical protein
MRFRKTVSEEAFRRTAFQNKAASCRTSKSFNRSACDVLNGTAYQPCRKRLLLLLSPQIPQGSQIEIQIFRSESELLS